MIIEYCGFISQTQTFIPNTKICLISLPAARQLKLGFVKILKFKFSRDADVLLRFWSWCLVDVLKMFDQDLCLNLWYELNPRVRCAFGNVWNPISANMPNQYVDILWPYGDNWYLSNKQKDIFAVKKNPILVLSGK